MLSQKSDLSKHKKIQIIPCTFCDHNFVKLEVNHKKKFGKTTNIWRLNNMLLNNKWVNQNIKIEIKKYMETKENENTQWSKTFGMQQKRS